MNSCYLGPKISPEQFIPEHMFLYLVKGNMNGYDGNLHYTIKAGQYCLIRKNQLARYNKVKGSDGFEKIAILFDESFLKNYQEKHLIHMHNFNISETFLLLNPIEKVPKFINSLKPYYKGEGRIDAKMVDVKREELLHILLQSLPELANLFFNYGNPYKINLEEFMNRNYKFNVNLERFAFLSGRSLSAFKRDFKSIFNETPSRWLTTKRLKEAHFLIDKKNKKPSEIYLDLGFEDLSHFSYAFKKKFGFTPSELGR
ncbi:helix-turn-helix domain-containing protein [Flexithrix dorotheae]|uniref:helix-turn-helix domain-containing protein n=1 Tax=Flexithrix dorotheae TaxID=70993 RepID=UPI001FE240C8|nr:helix-turn-helix domain-containing protein [Flexithrix dorotheae]